MWPSGVPAVIGKVVRVRETPSLTSTHCSTVETEVVLPVVVLALWFDTYVSMARFGLTADGSWPTVQDAYSIAVDTGTGAVLVVGEKTAQLQLITP